MSICLNKTKRQGQVKQGRRMKMLLKDRENEVYSTCSRARKCFQVSHEQNGKR